jgi:competence protein ComEC
LNKNRSYFFFEIIKKAFSWIQERACLIIVRCMGLYVYFSKGSLQEKYTVFQQFCLPTNKSQSARKLSQGLGGDGYKFHEWLAKWIDPGNLSFLRWPCLKHKLMLFSWSSLRTFWMEEFHRWILWFPVGVALGILLFFSYPKDPSWLEWISIGLLGALGIFLVVIPRRHKELFLWWGCICLSLSMGFFSAQVRTWYVNPVMLFKTTRPLTLEGKIRRLDHVTTQRLNIFQRIVLEDLTVVSGTDRPWGPNHTKLWNTEKQSLVGQEKVKNPGFLSKKAKYSLKNNVKRYDAKQPWPRVVRLTLRTTKKPFVIGQRIRLRAVLLPHKPPSHPWAHNWKRQMFFDGIGAGGYALSVPEILEEPGQGLSVSSINRLRNQLTRNLYEHIPKPYGSLACALITGDKASIPQDIRTIFSRSGLAHLLAISGIHLSIVAGIFIMFFEGILLIFPALSMGYPARYKAQILSLFPALFYLELSGRAYPVIRSFGMLCFFVTGILLNRRVMTLRSVLFMAFGILLFFPESLCSISFQLSFVAVITLGAFYESKLQGKLSVSPNLFVGIPQDSPWQKKESFEKTFMDEGPKEPNASFLKKAEASRIDSHFANKESKGWWNRMGSFLKGTIAPTLVVSLATDPFSLFFFQQFSYQGLFANVLAIPLTTFIILPLCIVVVICVSLGFVGGFVFQLLGKSLEALTWIATKATQIPYTFFTVSQGGTIYFILALMGWIWICLWSKSWRFYGVIPFCIGLWGLIFQRTSFPLVWLESEGKVVGIFDAQRRRLFISHTKRGKFVVKQWMQALGVSYAQSFPYFGQQGVKVYSAAGDLFLEKSGVRFSSKKAKNTLHPSKGSYGKHRQSYGSQRCHKSHGKDLTGSFYSGFLRCKDEDCYVLIAQDLSHKATKPETKKLRKLWIIQSEHGLHHVRPGDLVIDLWDGKNLKTALKKEDLKIGEKGSFRKENFKKRWDLERQFRYQYRQKSYERKNRMENFVGNHSYWSKESIAKQGGGVFWIQSNGQYSFESYGQNHPRVWNVNGLEKKFISSTIYKTHRIHHKQPS